MIWGLITKHEQLLKQAVDFIVDFEEKKNYNYFIDVFEFYEP
jgi:hypothetical protein